jgi:uncharacterized protein (TIGR03083 family)
MLVAERLHVADLLSGLTVEQLRQPTLCAQWSVHDVAAHLVSYLRLGRPKLYLAIAATAADFDSFNKWLTRRIAARPTEVLVDQLRRWSTSRMSIPRSGYDPVLADIVLHDLDIRRPLGLSRAPHEDRLRVTFNHLTRRPSPGFAMHDRLRGLRFVATDTGWTSGDGPLVSGPAEDVLLAIAGRTAALDTVEGDGVAVLGERLRDTGRAGPVRRLRLVVDVLVHPQPRERRSRAAVG